MNEEQRLVQKRLRVLEHAQKIGRCDIVTHNFLRCHLQPFQSKILIHRSWQMVLH